ncbi:MAG TPA: 30S ribosomal protein S8 [archaeon]|nr:30S ribosomal protein S8 [archaeon]
MSLVDPVADALISIKNKEEASHRNAKIRPASKVLKEILRVMSDHGYLNKFERTDDGREGIFSIELSGKINDCKAIKPRYAVKKNEFERFEKRYLPSKDIGILIVSTSKGIMSHRDAKKELIGGRLLAYVY